jgi:hypothetical protein
MAVAVASATEMRRAHAPRLAFANGPEGMPEARDRRGLVGPFRKKDFGFVIFINAAILFFLSFFESLFWVGPL